MVKWGDYTTIENEQKAEEIMEKLTSETYKDLPKDEKIRLANELEEYDRNIKINYIIDRNNDANLIIQDILDEIETVTAQDFEDRLLVNENIYNSALEHASTPEFMEFIKYTEENTKKQYSSFYNYILYDRIEEIMRALFLWNELTLDIEPIPPRGFENVIGKMENIKVLNFYAIYEYLDAKIHDKYNRLYPEQAEEENQGKNYTPQLPQAINANYEPFKLNRFKYPLDKINKGLWDWMVNEDDGQFSLFPITGKNRNPEIFVECFLKWPDQDGITIVKKLDILDKLLYCLAGSYWKQGRVFTDNEICNALYGSDANGRQRNDVNDRLTKMLLCRMSVTNDYEIKAGYHYEPIQYDGSLLPFERITKIVKGRKVSAYRLLREPPLLELARERKQIAELPIKLLRAPVNKTKENLNIQDYLLEEISHMKNNKSFPRKMLFKTICANCKITQPKQKNRLPEKLEKFLTYYTEECEWIKGYKMDNETKDVTIIL